MTRRAQHISSAPGPPVLIWIVTPPVGVAAAGASFAGGFISLYFMPELTGSVGEGPNQTNYSDRSSVGILGIDSVENHENQNSEKSNKRPTLQGGAAEKPIEGKPAATRGDLSQAVRTVRIFGIRRKTMRTTTRKKQQTSEFCQN